MSEGDHRALLEAVTRARGKVMLYSDALRANYGSNPWQDKSQIITSVSWVSRIEDARDSLLRSHWDLVIVDEAHKMSAASRDRKTLAYQLGEEVSKRTDHFLLMTGRGGGQPRACPAAIGCPTGLATHFSRRPNAPRLKRA